MKKKRLEKELIYLTMDVGFRGVNWEKIAKRAYILTETNEAER